MDTSKITRLEVIDEDGRRYAGRGKKLDVRMQDDGRTMKIFVEDKRKKYKLKVNLAQAGTVFLYKDGAGVESVDGDTIAGILDFINQNGIDNTDLFDEIKE